MTASRIHRNSILMKKVILAIVVIGVIGALGLGYHYRKPSIKSPESTIAIKTPKPTQVPSRVGYKVLPVLFVSEAPSGRWTGNWKNACEEASLAMVEFYYQNKQSVTIREAEEFMSMLFTEEDKKYGTNLNSDAEQMKFLVDNFTHFDAEIVVNPTIDQIKEEIDNNQPVLTLHYGFDLRNPNIPFLRTGTSYHAMVVIGYDDTTREFIVNDDGDTKTGANHRYDYELFMNTLHEYDYTTKKADGLPKVLFTSKR